MYLKDIDNFNNLEKVIRVDNLSNDILIRKVIFENQKYVEVLENQVVVFYENGKIIDVVYKKGIYEISIGDSYRDLLLWNFEIQKAEENEFGFLFINLAEIVNNKFFIRNPITYTDWSYEEEPFESKVKLEGIFNFQIVKPENFLKIVIGLRENYSKPELLEQIRIYILKSIEEGIKELSEKFKIDINTFVNKSEEINVKVSQNEYDSKLLSKGIKVTYFDIKKVDTDDNTKKLLELEEKYNDIK